MNKFYRSIGTSKQNYHQMMNRWLLFEEEKAQLRPLIHELRFEHPGMSARKLYLLIKPLQMGRDTFEQYCFSEGLRVKRVKNYQRTTDSSGVIRFPNLLGGEVLTWINQAWVSDITYYLLPQGFVYITFIMDLYSRYIVGFHLSQSLTTLKTTIPAIRMGMRIRGQKQLENCIIHSDGGGQYFSKEFIKLTSKLKMKNSMGKSVYENPHAERINGIIKNEYIKPHDPQTFQLLNKQLKHAVELYNNQRPHGSLKMKTPKQIEEKQIMLSTKLTLFNKEKSSKKESFITSTTFVIQN
jgi:hypothetical protein